MENQEITLENQEITPEQPQDLMPSYKKDCLRLGFYLTVIMLIREIASGLSPLLVPLLEKMSATAAFAFSLGYSALCLQIIPSILAVFMLRYSAKNLCGGFHAPKQTKRAFANFPALYGLGMTVNLTTMFVITLINSNADIGDSINSTGINPPDFASSWILFILLTVIAPVFEEFVFRGAVMELLKPYGSGLAVFVSAFCFGIYHGNFQQFFYAFALGICLGYIAYATGSLFCSTILHAMFNAVSGVILVFLSTDAVQTKSLDPMAELPDGQQLVVTFYAIFMIIILLTALIGFVAVIKKLIHIKKYRLPKMWGEVSNGKKLAVLLLTVPVIISLLLMIDIMVPQLLTEAIQQWAETIVA